MSPPPSLAAEIGRAYDTVPYDGGAMPELGLPVLRGAAAALGLDPTPGPAPDVLDIGCGAGAQLFLAAQQSAGRMVGIDASAGSCVRAQARGAALGPRWHIRHADVARIAAEELGQFDVIYVIGTAYVMPQPARAAALALLARCLRPGGVAVLTAYTGLVGTTRARLAAILRAGNNPSLAPGAQVDLARANLRAVAGAIPEHGATTALARAAIASLEASADVVLFHEALGPVFDPLHAAELEAALAPHGVAFLNTLPPLPLAAGAPSAVLARSADAWDFATGGSYRALLFAKPAIQGQGPGPRHPGITWSATLRRSGTGFTDASGGATITGNTPWAQAQLEALCAAPGSWPQLRAAALALMAGRGMALPDEAVFDAALDETLMLLWRQSLAQPGFAPPG